MKTYRGINWLIAEKFMGWHVWKNKNGDLMVANKNGYNLQCPSFTTTDVWQIVDKLKERGFYVIIQTPPKAKSKFYWVYVKNHYTDKIYVSYGLTAQLAICKVALKTVGIEID